MGGLAAPSGFFFFFYLEGLNVKLVNRTINTLRRSPETTAQWYLRVDLKTDQSFLEGVMQVLQIDLCLRRRCS